MPIDASLIRPDRRVMTLAVLALTFAGCRENREADRSKATVAPPYAGHASGLYELVRLDPSIRLDIRYARADNFTGRPLYTQPRAFLVKPAAKALVRAHRAAAAHGHGLTIFDAYRPWRVTKALWDATPPGPKRNYVANPRRGSKHNRGCAVDLTLHDLKTGLPVEMPSGYDEFTSRAHRNFSGTSTAAINNRKLLETLMTAHGFRGASNEWWHFDFAAWRDFPLLDIAFEDMSPA